MKDKIHLRANFTILAIFVSVIMTSITIISQIYLPDTTTDIIRASSLMAG